MTLFLTDSINRIYLKKYPASDEDSDYLSAVYVDGVRFQNQYLAAQLPMPSTINDFWRMIAEFKVELIVMLQPPDPNDFVRTCTFYVRSFLYQNEYSGKNKEGYFFTFIENDNRNTHTYINFETEI